MRFKLGIEKVKVANSRNIYGEPIIEGFFYKIVKKSWAYYLFGKKKYLVLKNTSIYTWTQDTKSPIKVNFSPYLGDGFDTKEEAQKLINAIKKNPNRFILY